MSERLLISDQDMAAYFLQASHVAPGTAAIDLEPRVTTWLSRSNMAHRDAWLIAIEAEKAVRTPEPAPLPTPEETEFGRAVVKGIDDVLADLGSMPMADYEKWRAEHGIGQSSNAVGIFGR
jgi:hypothetical protein